MNRKNLIIGAKYLFEHVKDEEFNMRFFRQRKGVPGEIGGTQARMFACGTVGCFIGSMPQAPGLYLIHEDSCSGYNPLTCGIDWQAYGDRIFALTENEFMFLASGQWAKIDNTRLGAVKRAIYLLNNPARVIANVFRIKYKDIEPALFFEPQT